MRVAVIGGSFLGCATSFYIRRTLSSSQDVQITIFEKSERLGGTKFQILQVKAGDEIVEAPVGTMVGVDLECCPSFRGLLKETGFPAVRRRDVGSFAVYDWDKDEYLIWHADWGWLGWFIGAVVLYGCLKGVARAFGLGLRDLRSVSSLWIAFFVILIVEFILGVWMFGTRITTAIQTHLTFQTAPGRLGLVLDNIREHVETVASSEEATKSGISLAHFLSRCGFLKYVSVSASEKYSELGLNTKFLRAVVEPGMKLSIDGTVGADHTSNALGSLLSASQSAMLPLRKKPSYLSAKETKKLCHSIAHAAEATLRLNTEVIRISCASSGDSYDLTVKTPAGSESVIKEFDAIVICCVPDLSTFSIPMAKSLASDLAVDELQANATPSKPYVSTTCYASLVYGNLKPQYFRFKSEASVPTHLSIIGSPKIHSITRMKKLKSEMSVYRVYTSEKLKKGAPLLATIFSKVDNVESVEKRRTPYPVTPMRKIDGDDIPAVILERRAVYAAGVKRIGGGIELDCMMAKNAASLLGSEVTWK